MLRLKFDNVLLDFRIVLCMKQFRQSFVDGLRIGEGPRLLLRKTEDGTRYAAEAENGPLMLEVLSLDCIASPDFVYRGAAGETLTAKELLEKLWSQEFSLSDEILEIAFDSAGMLLWAEGPAIPETDGADDAGDSEWQYDPLSLWAAGSKVKDDLIAYVEAVSDEWSEDYIAPADRIAVFDLDGTLYGERFPTYFDICLFLHRALHDESYTAEEDVRAYAEALETARALTWLVQFMAYRKVVAFIPDWLASCSKAAGYSFWNCLATLSAMPNSWANTR